MKDLKEALDQEFQRIKSSLRVVTGDRSFQMPVTNARIEAPRKFSQVYIAADEKLYLPVFWRDGVCLAHGKTSNIAELAAALSFWLLKDISTKRLAEEFTFISPAAKSIAFDEGYEVDLPMIVPLGDGLFEVRNNADVPVDSGTAAEALGILKRHLPSNIPPAIKGTADDIL